MVVMQGIANQKNRVLNAYSVTHFVCRSDHEFDKKVNEKASFFVKHLKTFINSY